MTLKNSTYRIGASTLAGLCNRNRDHCVSCNKQLMLNDEVTSKRSSNNLRIRCMECSQKYNVWIQPQDRKADRQDKYSGSGKI